MTTVTIKRVYDKPEAQDGKRILVDRLWPRGLSKAKARIDLWLKDIAPSSELRVWFGHDPAKWEEFARRYHAELAANTAAVGMLRQQLEHGHTTLLFSAKDTKHNNAVALKAYLERQ
ncbi:MAG TPA: DUF488 domain-containing protein [Candidatus Saccharimonadales bacterium]|nr:DUF488 domain-containing protein [Candidatus Saccharimonadales bacterium]